MTALVKFYLELDFHPSSPAGLQHTVLMMAHDREVLIGLFSKLMCEGIVKTLFCCFTETG